MAIRTPGRVVLTEMDEVSLSYSSVLLQVSKRLSETMPFIVFGYYSTFNFAAALTTALHVMRYIRSCSDLSHDEVLIRTTATCYTQGLCCNTEYDRSP